MEIRKAGVFSQRFALAAAALSVLLVLPAGPTQAEPASPFVAALIGVWDSAGDPIIPEVLQSSATEPVVVETGSLPTAYGKSRGAFGSNGFDMQTTGGIDREVDGGSIWTEGFTVSGGPSGGVLSVSTRIQGSVSGHAEMAYGLYVSPQPFDLDTILATVGDSDGFWAVQLPNATRVLFTGVANRCGQSGASDECGHVPYDNFQGSLDITLGANVPFENGQTVYVASLFAGGVGVHRGSESFLNSADFGISAPADATIASLSGTQYQAAAVPEPSVVGMLAVGVALVGWRGRRFLNR